MLCAAASSAPLATPEHDPELFTDILKYNPWSEPGILLTLERLRDSVSVSLTDFDADPFDIGGAATVDADRPIEDRKPGGLGFHLAKKLVDRIDYECEGRRSRTTFVKMLEQGDAGPEAG